MCLSACVLARLPYGLNTRDEAAKGISVWTFDIRH